MKNFFVSIFLLVGVIAECSHARDTKRSPASVKDVGVVGPDGEVILYYKEGDDIIIKDCDPYTIIGIYPDEARVNCQGRSTRIPVDYFKQSLRNLVSSDRLNILKPLTPQEVGAYSKDGISPEQLEAMVLELEKINKFIATYGTENANLIRKEELVTALRSKDVLLSAIKKINIEIERALDLIAEQTEVNIIKFNINKDQFLYNALKQLNSNLKFACGLTGSVAERIKNCSYQPNSKKEGFVLVTKSKELKEVYLEVATGLLWSDRTSGSFSHYEAEGFCNVIKKEIAGLTGHNWRLPSKDEYDRAEISGIRKALPSMNFRFWTSSALYRTSNIAWIFNGFLGETGYHVRHDNINVAVRCVALLESGM